MFNNRPGDSGILTPVQYLASVRMGIGSSRRLRRAALAVALLALLVSVVALRDGKGSGDPASRRVRLSATATPAPTLTAAPTPSPQPTPTLRETLAQALTGADACLVATDGRATVTLESDRPLVPASAQKVFVAAAALRALGPDHRFTTRVLASPPAADGTVDALWLVGGGDALLATPEYAQARAAQPRWSDLPFTSLAGLADRIVAAGVRRVAAGVHGDDSRHDRTRFLDGWKPVYATEGSISPLGALTVNEGWRTWTPSEKPTDQPAAYAASELARLLRDRGLAVEGAVAAQTAPSGLPELASVVSAPLTGVVTGMLRSSDNLVAELLVRELGLARAGEATTAAGVGVVTRTLSAARIPLSGVTILDGSGLHPANRATCRALAAAAGLPGMADRLAVAGGSGTLIRRTSPPGATLVAKTGSIRGVVSMVGQMRAARTVTFAIVQNAVTSTAGRANEDRVLVTLADWAAGRLSAA